MIRKLFRFLPQRLKHRVSLLIGFLGAGTVIINLIVLFVYLNSFLKNNIEHIIDSNFKINEYNLTEAILYDDVYTIFETLKKITENSPYISDIYLFDNNKRYVLDSKVKRDAKTLQDFDKVNFKRVKTIKIKDEPIGYLVFLIDQMFIINEIKNNLLNLAMINFAIIFFGVMLGLYLTKILIRPMNNFINQINELDYDKLPFKTSVPEYASYEIKKLSDTLNNMSERLAAALNKLYEEERKVRKNEKLASIGMMAAGLAHELKNPIMTINLIVYQLKKCSAANNSCSEDLKVIQSEANRLVKRINEFLEYSKPIDVRKAEVEVESINYELRQYVMKRFDNVSLKILYDLKKIYTDKEKLLQVLLNLINNSIEAKANEIIMKVTGDNSDIIIEFEDNGEGISIESEGKIFMPFYTTKSSGTGLGLAICDMIITAMDGELVFERGRENGAKFIIRLRDAYVC
ncbi:ATP-binding protein [Deferribacter abyssi]|uniref:ATP-binding protein n=1 Tax=Deferribacter abyssi TaxID=213806 RepID=UPI003C23A9E5